MCFAPGIWAGIKNVNADADDDADDVIVIMNNELRMMLQNAWWNFFIE